MNAEYSINASIRGEYNVLRRQQCEEDSQSPLLDGGTIVRTN